MKSALTEISQYLSVINELNRYTISIGILDADRKRVITLKTTDLDGSELDIAYSAEDLLYLNETGSLGKPARPVLDYIAKKFDLYINDRLLEIYDNVFEKNWTIGDIDAFLRFHVETFNNTIPQLIKDYVNSVSGLSENNGLLMQLQNLEKYIRCSILKK